MRVWNRLPPEGRAPDTDGYDISEVRGDLRFSRPFIPILSPFSCFLFSRGRAYPPLPLPFPPASDPQSVFLFLAPLLFFSLLPPFDLAFPSFVLFHPLVATPTTYIDSLQRLEEEEEEEEKMKKRKRYLSLSLFFSVSR